MDKLEEVIKWAIGQAGAHDAQAKSDGRINERFHTKRAFLFRQLAAEAQQAQSLRKMLEVAVRGLERQKQLHETCGAVKGDHQLDTVTETLSTIERMRNEKG